MTETERKLLIVLADAIFSITDIDPDKQEAVARELVNRVSREADLADGEDSSDN